MRSFEMIVQITADKWIAQSHPTGNSIKSIDQLFHLHQTCPCYQTLRYYFRKCPTPLCKSIHSIDQLQTDYAIYRSAVIYTIISKDLFLTGKSIKSIDQLLHLHQTCPCYQTLHYHFRKFPTPLYKFIHSIDQLQTDSIDYTLSFTSDLSMLSDSTLTFSKMPHPTVQIYTFH